MTARDDFLTWVHTELREAEMALHQGDASGRRAIWSRNEPVTVFGAWRNALGRAEVDALFAYLEQTFSGCRSHEYEILAADVMGDMAYTVGIEHTQATAEGEDRAYSLRVTQIYRREAGEWKVVHRHGDESPERDQAVFENLGSPRLNPLCCNRISRDS
ncbi:nuclear transport factor 2 family protein [Glycomyces rhizosphaerae]|uniref:Nuclear transport factor 2 family protein n=1 Tax=Glycomyces rhizosphaerae TaxID=2054422 RepID=A0ABV7Q8F0_9ACTN